MTKNNAMILSLIVLIFSVLSGEIQAGTTTRLSEILILPEDARVQIKLPDTSQVIDVSSIRAIAPGTQILAEKPVKILCPDLRLIEVQPGEAFICPPLEQEATLVVEVQLPPLKIRKVKAPRGDELANLTSAEQQRIRQADTEITALPLADEHQLFVRASLYIALHLYSEAQRLFDHYQKPLIEPASLRLQAQISWETGDLRQAYARFNQALERSQALGDAEGEAFALHAQAMLLAASAEEERALQKAQAAQKIYAALGYTLTIEQLLQPGVEE